MKRRSPSSPPETATQPMTRRLRRRFTKARRFRFSPADLPSFVPLRVLVCDPASHRRPSCQSSPSMASSLSPSGKPHRLAKSKNRCPLKQRSGSGRNRDTPASSSRIAGPGSYGVHRPINRYRYLRTMAVSFSFSGILRHRETGADLTGANLRQADLTKVNLRDRSRRRISGRGRPPGRGLHAPGNEIDVQWDGRLCIHIPECGGSHKQMGFKSD